MGETILARPSFQDSLSLMTFYFQNGHFNSINWICGIKK